MGGSPGEKMPSLGASHLLIEQPSLIQYPVGNVLYFIDMANVAIVDSYFDLCEGNYRYMECTQMYKGYISSL